MTFSDIHFATIKLVSFDVFDTVIARRCGAPTNVFRIVGRKLCERNVFAFPHPFDSARCEAEQRAKHHNGGREVTLAEIYKEFNSFWRLPEPLIKQLIAIELETERENFFLVPGAVEMVNAARIAGKRVAFASDMYLPEGFLQNALHELGLIQDGETLYVSSQWEASKADGRLYRVMLERENLSPDKVLHIGDSYFSDYENARKAGLHAIHYDRGTLNRFELALAAAEASGSDRVPKMAGLARLARLETDSSGRHSIPARLGASIAGPLLTSYAAWLLRTASNRGIKRLHFLARDGEALLRICELLAPAMGLTALKLSYLYGSRQVWYPPFLLRCNEAAAEFFASAVAFNARSWQDCVAYLGLNPSDPRVSAMIQKWTIDGRGVEARRRLFLELIGSAVLGPVVRDWLSQKAQLTSRYLREAGVVGSEPCALVDCGWSGTWTEILADLITDDGGIRPEVYFLGRRGGRNSSRTHTLTYLFDHQAGSGLQVIPEYFHIFVELALTANQGRTLGFAEREGKLAPDLAPADLQGFTTEEWTALRKALNRYAELYAGRLDLNQLGPDLRATLVDLVSMIWEQPSTGEAAFLARHRIGLSPVNSVEKVLARSYRYRDVVRLALRFRLPGYPPYWWHEGAQALTALVPRAIMAALWETRELLRRLLAAYKTGIGFRSVPELVQRLLRKVQWQLVPLSDTLICLVEPKTPFPKPQASQAADEICCSPLSLAPVDGRSE